jgi:hypothetical protein
MEWTVKVRETDGRVNGADSENGEGRAVILRLNPFIELPMESLRLFQKAWEEMREWVFEVCSLSSFLQFVASALGPTLSLAIGQTSRLSVVGHHA